ncbi:MAG TPA: hypothetical protein VNG90_00515 [Candidatus Acidoferrum sp.]|nr:hypothetical protein [Candidatus Acidoferrum sp.]
MKAPNTKKYIITGVNKLSQKAVFDGSKSTFKFYNEKSENEIPQTSDAKRMVWGALSVAIF